MTATIIVQLENVDLDRFYAANDEHAETLAEVKALAQKHGMISGERFLRGTTLIDVDEWESEAAYFGFIAEAHTHLEILATARGTSPMDGLLWKRL